MGLSRERCFRLILLVGFGRCRRGHGRSCPNDDQWYFYGSSILLAKRRPNGRASPGITVPSGITVARA